MEHVTENQTENRIESTPSSAQQAESRSQYQKRKREAEKQEKRRGRKKAFALAMVLVILAGVMCGTVIAGTINTPHDTVKIASANVEYVKDTVQGAVKGTLSEFSELLSKLQHSDDIDTPAADEPEKKPDVPAIFPGILLLTKARSQIGLLPSSTDGTATAHHPNQSYESSSALHHLNVLFL